MTARVLRSPQTEACACGCGGRPRKSGAQYIRGHRPPSSPADRFWPKVRQADACWVWLGAVANTGYGSFYVAPGAFTTAHRFAYELLVGPVPPGLELDHLCRNRLCCNPAHLEPVTQAENKRRANAVRGLATHCKHGHEYTPENTFIRKDGWRECRACITRRNHQRKGGQR